MHFVMHILFYEDDVSPASNNLLVNKTGSTFPKRSLVLYKNPAYFISKLVKTLKFHKVYNAYTTDTSSAFGGGSQLSSSGYLQLVHKDLY